MPRLRTHTALALAFALGAGASAQIRVDDREGRISRLPDGKGLLIGDFRHFRSQVARQVAAADAAIGAVVPEPLRRKADSLFTVLREQRAVAMDPADIALVALFPSVDDEPRIIANLVFSLPRLGGSRSLDYAVRKGDTVLLQYTVLRGAGFDEVEVVEGKEVRFSAARNARGRETATEIPVLADGLLTVNLSNKGPLPSKGRLLVTLRPALRRLALEYRCDTVEQTVRRSVLRTDTLAETLFSQVVRLAPRQDITRSPRLRIDIPLTAGRQYLAWGYWLGSRPTTLDAWEALRASDSLQSPLARYLGRELGRKDPMPLPEERNPHLRLTLQAAAAPAATPPRPNYACHPLPSEGVPRRVIGLELENRSAVYAYPARLDVVGLYAETRTVEVEAVERACREYLKLSFQ